MKIINAIALALVIIGGLNWGLVGAANIDLVARIFGDGTMAARIVYCVVGLAALYSLSFFKAVATGDYSRRSVSYNNNTTQPVR